MFGIHLHLNLFIIIVNLFFSAYSEIPRTVLCADPTCSDPISEAQGKISYTPSEEHVLGFKKGTKILITSKSKEKDGYWGARIGNRIGFVPSTYVKEVTVWKSRDMLQYEVPTIAEAASSLSNENINQGNVDAGNTIESKIPETPQISPLSNIIHGGIHSMSGEPLHETQNPQLTNSQKEPVVPLPTSDTVPSSQQVHEIPINVGGQEINSQEKPETGGIPVEVSVSQTISESINIEKRDGSLNSEIPRTEDPSIVLNAMSSEQVNSDEKISTEPAPMTSVNTNQNINEKIQEENTTINPDTIKLVDEVNEKENNDSVDSSNIKTSGSSGQSPDSEIEDDIENIDKLSVDILSEMQGNLNKVPLIVEDNDPSLIQIEDSQKNEPPINYEQFGNNWKNILPNHNEGLNAQPELKSDTGTVNEINETAIELEMNDTLANENTANVSAFVSSSSSNSGSGSIVDSYPTADHGGVVQPMNDNIKQSGMPSQEFQKDSNIPNMAEGVNAKAQFGQHDQHIHSPDFVHIPLGEAPYNYMRQRENFNSETTTPPPVNIGVPTSTPSPVVINTDNTQAYQFVTPPSEPLSQEPVTEGKPMQDPYGDIKQPYNDYKEIPPTQEPPPPMNIQTEDVEKPATPQTVEDIVGDNFHYELPTHSPPEEVTDNFQVTENPAENSNVESSTPAPLPDAAYQNADEKTNQDADHEGGFFSSMLSWVGIGSKKQEPEPEIQEGNRFEETLFAEPPSLEVNNKENIIATDGTCQAPDGTTVNCNDASDENNSAWSFWLDNKTMTSTSSYNTFIYLVVTAVTVLLFTLGYYFIEKFRSDGPLIAKVNKLEQELLVSSKECLILKDELANTKEKLNLFETSSNDKIITSLQQELEEAKKVKAELENNIEVLQQELDAATEAGLDLNRMLSEVLTQKGGSETLMESVEHLQAQLNNQQKIIDEMTSKLFTKTNENQELQDELTAASEKIESLEGEIEDMRGNLNVHLKDNEDVIKELTSKNNELQIKINQMNDAKEKEIAKLKKNVGELEKKMKAMADSLKIKEEECNNLKDSIKKIKMKDGKSIDALFDASRIKAELSQATSENTSLKDRLKAEEDKFAKLNDKVKKLEEEIEKLKQISSEAEKEKTEAQTRLEVLSNYFKEKETQLQKELGLREAMWVQKQGDDSTIYERMKSLEEEISSYKSQNEALKKEILDQERGLKAQITTLEKKAHENWIAARQAERKLEETKQEAAQLRNKMTLMEKNISNDLESSQHHRVNDELNGGDALSPLIHDTSSPILFPPPLPLDPNNSSLMPPGFIPPPMFMPPPPGGFMPPPPPFLPGDHRPPPLGRMSSPPLNSRFSPPPPDYAYDRMSTPPLSPSNRNYRSPNESDRERFRHRTPTSPSFRSRNWEEGPSGGMSGFRPITSERDSRREHKGGSNLSSGHSSDSLDKSSRHSSRV